ncbi:hypothetical protein B296_00037401, partial [Ensete ventricosum]
VAYTTYPRLLLNLQSSAIVATCLLAPNCSPLLLFYLDEKLIDTDTVKFHGLFPLVLSWYLAFVFAFSTFSAPFMTNALPPGEQWIDDSTEVNSAAKPIPLSFVSLSSRSIDPLKRKFQCSLAPSFDHLGMATNTLSSTYRPLYEYQIFRVSNFPHLYEHCTTLSVVIQHIPLFMVSSFTKRPLALSIVKFTCQC